MHLYQWIGDVVGDCTNRGFIRQPVILTQMNDALETLRASDGWGVPSLPFAYVLFVTMLVKLYLFNFCFYMASFVWLNRVMKDIPGWSNIQSDANFNAQSIWLCFIMVMVNFFYQGALDFHALIRKPNQVRCYRTIINRLSLHAVTEYPGWAL